MSKLCAMALLMASCAMSMTPDKCAHDLNTKPGWRSNKVHQIPGSNLYCKKKKCTPAKAHKSVPFATPDSKKSYVKLDGSWHVVYLDKARYGSEEAAAFYRCTEKNRASGYCSTTLDEINEAYPLINFVVETAVRILSGPHAGLFCAGGIDESNPEDSPCVNNDPPRQRVSHTHQLVEGIYGANTAFAEPGRQEELFFLGTGSPCEHALIRNAQKILDCEEDELIVEGEGLPTVFKHPFFFCPYTPGESAPCSPPLVATGTDAGEKYRVFGQDLTVMLEPATDTDRYYSETFAVEVKCA